MISCDETHLCLKHQARSVQRIIGREAHVDHKDATCVERVGGSREGELRIEGIVSERYEGEGVKSLVPIPVEVLSFDAVQREHLQLHASLP